MRIAAFLFSLALLAQPAFAADCATPAGFADAAAKNAQSLTGSSWTFTEGREGAPEGPGWEAYAALAGQTIGTSCGADTPAFAGALAAWQRKIGQKPTGMMSPDTVEALKQAWHAQRRHVRRAASGPCPIADEGQVTEVAARDTWGKPARLLRGAYAAYRAMMEAARREAPYIFTGNADLKIVSAWRTQQSDVDKCKTNKCSRVSMAPSCSAHWGGRAIDLNVGSIAGHGPADMDWQNRVFQSRQPAYRWLLKNARRFGFANYFAEPWHWEWNGG